MPTGPLNDCGPMSPFGESAAPIMFFIARTLSPTCANGVG